MENTSFGFESLLPPIVAILFAIATRRVVLPLAAGVLVGALLLAHADPATPWWDAGQRFVISIFESVSSTPHLQALAFSLLLGGMVGVLERGGGMTRLIQLMSKRVHSRRGAQTLVATSGLMIFFDDYANTLLLGGTMRGSADKYRVSREKLAYLVDSTAAPVAGLSLVSTWAAIEIGYIADGLAQAGVLDSAAAFQMFVQSIPFRFYPWLAIAMVMLVAITGRDFGPMRRAEQNAMRRPPTPIDESGSPHAVARKWLWLAAVLPIVVCLIAVLAVLVWTGVRSLEDPGSGPGTELTRGTLRYVGEILGNGDSYVALVVGGGCGLVVAIATHLLLRGCDLRSAFRFAGQGSLQMMPAVVILWFAWALSDTTEKLGTGAYLGSLLSDQLAPQMLPTVVFLIAGVVAFSTGTSWGTMGILTPLSIALAFQLDPIASPSSPIVLATCGSVLAGAIFGDHCSPISDTTVLSSRASGCDHVAHVRTQMPYALVVASLCVLVGTIPAPLGLSPWLSLLIGVACIVVVVRWIGRRPTEGPSV